MIYGDCMHASIPVFDLLYTDPPYGSHVHERMTSCAQSGHVKGVRHRDAGFAPLSLELRNHIARAAGTAKRWSLIYSDIQGINAWEQTLARHVRTVPVTLGAEDEDIVGGGVVGSLPWIRWSSPQQSGDRPPSGCEMITIGHAPGRMRWGGPGNLVALIHKCERGDQKHPTAKPLDQALDLVAWFSDPGETVYDPCAGRGTAGVACALLGRSFIGYEIDPEHAAIGHTRIKDAQSGILNACDLARYRRWAESCGASPIPGQAVGAKCVKGKIVT